ncbi:MAG TPA: GIY-YIG nuclease family protein, partial [Salegentibacter sp.]|uniref:GIY-YIG nuclease family protein n=1 Tax=Salegentibacter sp. TaxID=1903072 RepID=UPI002F942691
MNPNYQYHIYIITNHKNGTLYIGMTGDLKQRLYQHKNQSLKSFSSRYRLNKLVYYEEFEYPSLAIKREKQLKKWN